MARYIDADALPICKEYCVDEAGFGARFYVVHKDDIDNAPTVDAVEVVHGRWLYDSGSGKHFCSACSEDALSFRRDTLGTCELYETCLTDFCPYCGADMRERRTDDT